MTRLTVLLSATAYIACVVLANVLTDHYGLVNLGIAGLTCTAGTFAAGAVLLARNVTQDLTSRLLVLGLMTIGAGLSWWLASAALATASLAAFAVSEGADMAVYTPLRARGWARAVATASVVGAVVDTLLFLHLAGFPVTTDSVTGQLVVKIGISWAVALAGGTVAVLRQPVHARHS